MSLLLLTSPAWAGWIEENGSSCTNAVYVGSMTVNASDGTDVITINGSGNVDITGTLTVDTIDDSGGAYITVSSDAVNSAGRWGVTDALGNTEYIVIVSTVMPDAHDYTITNPDAKAGGFFIMAGSYTATGTFTAAGAVTLGNSSTFVSNSNGTDGYFNVYDGGTALALDNQNGGSVSVWGIIVFTN